MEHHCCDHTLNTQFKFKIIEQNQRLGQTVSLKDTLYNTLNQECTKGSFCLQFFLGGNTNYNCRSLSQLDKEISLKHCLLNDKTFYVHCPYVANLAKPNDDDVVRSKYVIQKYIDEINGLPASAVLHFGKVGSIENVGRRINELNLKKGYGRTPFPLLIENAAGQGTELGKTYDEFRKLFESIDNNVVGVCLDTQHVFGSGYNQLQTYEDIVKLFDDFDHNLQLIHLNDSMVECGCNKDRHQSLKNGYIWGKNDEGLKYLIQRCVEKELDMVLETPNMDKDFLMVREFYF
jgi:deoxyribonuclease IV